MIPEQSSSKHNKSKPIPTFASLGATTPVFIRKLDASGDWNPPERTLLFNLSDGADQSMYLVSNDAELCNAFGALNAKRPRDSQIDFVWIRPEELRTAQIIYEQTNSEKHIYCFAARKLHHDAWIDRAKPTEVEAHDRLIAILIAAGRKKYRLTRGQANSLADQVEPTGCQSYSKNRESKTDCESCRPCRPLLREADKPLSGKSQSAWQWVKARAQGLLARLDAFRWFSSKR